MRQQRKTTKSREQWHYEFNHYISELTTDYRPGLFVERALVLKLAWLAADGVLSDSDIGEIKYELRHAEAFEKGPWPLARQIAKRQAEEYHGTTLEKELSKINIGAETIRKWDFSRETRSERGRRQAEAVSLRFERSLAEALRELTQDAREDTSGKRD